MIIPEKIAVTTGTKRGKDVSANSFSTGGGEMFSGGSLKDTQASPCFLMSATLESPMPFILTRSSNDENGLKEINSLALVSPMWIIFVKSSKDALLISIFSMADAIPTRTISKTAVIDKIFII